MSRAQRKFTNRRYLDAIADHVVVFDGAMGTSIQTQAPVAADFGDEQYFGCVDYLSITRPDMIEAIHDSFLAVGCEVVETNTSAAIASRSANTASASARSRSTALPPAWRAASATVTNAAAACPASSPVAWAPPASCRAQ